MNNKLKVVWYNGIHLDKIHFEQQERYIENLIHTKTARCFCNLYGIFEVDFSHEMLSLGKIALTKISGIAQDGSIFSAPNNDLLPETLEIGSNTNSSIITLKISMNTDSIADVSLQNAFLHSKYLATNVAISSKIHDDVTQSLSPKVPNQEIQYTQDKMNIVLGSLRLKLGLLGDKTPNELEIPIGKIKDIHSNKKIELDEKFIPTSLDVSKNAFINAFLEEMLFSIKQHKEVLTQIFKGINQTKNTLDFSTYLSLNLLKKYYLVFSYLIQKEKLHPELLYEKLIDFQADLLALSHNENFDFIPYAHNDLSSVFVPLSNNLRILFANITSPKYAMANIIDNGNGFYDCIFDNASMLQNGEIFLAISSSMPMNTLIETFVSQSKIHTQSNIKSIVTSQIKGLNLEPIPSIPSSLPHLSGYAYFKLDKKDPIFLSFINQNIISIYLTNNITNPDIKLWAILQD